jgi:hypothetical protein
MVGVAVSLGVSVGDCVSDGAGKEVSVAGISIDATSVATEVKPVGTDVAEAQPEVIMKTVKITLND